MSDSATGLALAEASTDALKRTAQAAQQLAYCRKVEEELGADEFETSYVPPRILVIVASSRGASSLLFELLRATGGYVSLQGEHTPLYKVYNLMVAQVNAPSEHDGTVPQWGGAEGFRKALIGQSQDWLMARTEQSDKRSASYCARLLSRQWPQLGLSAKRLLEAGLRLASVPGESFESDIHRLSIIAALDSRVDTRYYDFLWPARAGQWLPIGPPNGLTSTVEAPPFIIPRPGVQATEENGDRPLLLKASVDAYRLGVLRDVLAGYDVRIVHLTRNPAAAISGLMDGWMHHGFFSHWVGSVSDVSIDGYHSHGSNDGWWNFDLPPNWSSMTSGHSLAEVCAFQWRSAHREILRSIQNTRIPFLRVRAEDLYLPDTMSAAIRKIAEFAGARIFRGPVPKIVMSTETPTLGRWRLRRDVIDTVISDHLTTEVSAELGYGKVPDDAWI